MDRKFLEEVTKGYLVDHDVYGEFQESQVETIYETVFNELKETVDFIYEVDQNTYAQVKSYSKLRQQRVLEIYLNSMYLKDDEIEEGIIGGAASVIGSTASGIGSAFASLPLWGQGGVGILTIYFLYKHKGEISRKIFNVIKQIGKVSESVGDFLQKRGRFARFRYAVIQENVEKCYKKCGVRDLNKNLSVKDYLNKYAADNPKATEKAKCLAQCYVQHEVAKVKLVMKMYFICLRQTGNFDNIRDLSTEKFMSMLMSGDNNQKDIGIVGASCVEYFKTIDESMKNINTMIEYFFEDRRNRQEMIMLVQQDVDKVKRNVANMNDQEIKRLST